jgi:diguanylate cyclase (GGDEF)-like protein
MRGASRITAAAGGILVSAAWIVGSFGPFDSHRTVTDIFAEASAVFVLGLAWRYRRDRLAIVSLLIAAANFLVRTGRVPLMGDVSVTALALVVAADVAIVAVAGDHKVARPAGLLWLTIIAAQVWWVVEGVHLAGPQLTRALQTPGLAAGSLIAAVVIVLISFALRRDAFEGSLLWAVIACAAALAGRSGVHAALLLFASAQLALLVGLFEDSYRLAFHDELTGLPGRRALDEATRSLTGSFTIAMVDIDHFKRFNDRHGHDAGDQVLRMVADELHGVGGGGRAHRYGGEEFTILFPGATVADVRDVLEDLRASIAGRTFSLRGPDRPRKKPEKPKPKGRPSPRVTVTVSVGAAGSNSRRPTPAAVLKAADHALYRAKNAGRNRVVAAGDRISKKS